MPARLLLQQIQATPQAASRRRVLRLGVAAAVAGSQLGWSQRALADAGGWVVGQVLPLSGVLRQTGEDLVAGARLAFDAVNAQGGVHGRKIRHVVKDDGYAVDQTVSLTTELIAQDKPIALVAMVGTGNLSALLAAQTLDKSQLALVGPYTGGQSLREPYNPFIFHVRASYQDEARAMVAHLLQTGSSQIAVMYQDDAFGQSGLEGIQGALASKGLKPVAAASYPKNTDDVALAVKTILAAKPQAVCLISVTRSSAAFIKQYRAAGGLAQIFSISVVNIAQLSELAGRGAVRGLGITQVMPYPFQPRLPLVSEYLDQLKLPTQHPARRPDYTSFEAYVAARVLIEGLKRAGPKASSKTMLDALEGLGKFNLSGYALQFGPNRREGSRFVETTVLDGEGRLIR